MDKLVKRLWECASGECFNCSQYTDTTNASVCSKELMKQAADAIVKLTDIRVGKWIPVTERLPEEYTTILFVSGSGQVHVGYYDSEHKGFCDMTGFRYVCTHWIPLPQPPKEE